MTDYISSRKRRNTISHVSYIFLNIALAIISTLVTVISGSWLFGVLLVLFSKWRVFAVRPRYWWSGIKANAVDIIVGVSIVFLIYFAWTNSTNASLANPIYFILTAIYIIWLVVLKPKSDEKSTEIQALLAVFLGSSVTTLLATWDFGASTFVVVATFLIAYSAFRHIIIQMEYHQANTIPIFAFSLMMAEMSWITYHWSHVYSIDLKVLPVFQLPQAAITETILAFLFIRAYKSYLRHDNKITAHDILPPLIFSVLIMLAMIFFFSNLNISI